MTVVSGAGASADRDRLLGGLAIALGSALAFVAQLIAPVGLPLYDGVVVQEPYRYLHPGAGQAGSPASFTSIEEVDGTISPLFAAATTEGPPQAQLIALQDAFELTPGAASLHISITPVEPPPVAPEGAIVGNVYRFSVTDQDGTPLAFRPCEGCVTLSLRSPEGVEGARLMRYAGGEWIDVDAYHEPTTGMYSWNATGLGDLALVSVPGGLGLDRIVVFGGAAVILVLLFAAALVFRRRGPGGPVPAWRAAGPDSPTRPRSRAIPSKRKGPRRPPPGRSDR